jgi:hypothetical protein
MWVMVFSILVQGDNGSRSKTARCRDYLHMRFESREECTRAGLERDVKLIEAGAIAQFKCVQREAENLEWRRGERGGQAHDNAAGAVQA